MTTDAREEDRSAAGSAEAPSRPSTGVGDRARVAPGRSTATPEARSFELKGLVLLDSAGNHPVAIHGLRFGEDGIGLVGREGSPPRVLPWASVSAHAVEPWGGGTIPPGWMDPRRQGRTGQPGPGQLSDGDDGSPAVAVEPQRELTPNGQVPGAGRPLPHVEAGALIDIRTPSGTFRFLLPRGDPATVADQIAAIAVRQRGVTGASSVTTAVGGTRRARWRTRAAATGWERAQPVLVILLVVVIAAAVTLILLQSSGAIHLPFLGGTGSGSAAAPPGPTG
jgi:hypothetical protein